MFAACDLKRQTSVLSAYGLELDRRRTDALISATLQTYIKISTSTSTESVSDSKQSCAALGTSSPQIVSFILQCITKTLTSLDTPQGSARDLEGLSLNKSQEV